MGKNGQRTSLNKSAYPLWMPCHRKGPCMWTYSWRLRRQHLRHLHANWATLQGRNSHKATIQPRSLLKWRVWHLKLWTCNNKDPKYIPFRLVDHISPQTVKAENHRLKSAGWEASSSNINSMLQMQVGPLHTHNPYAFPCTLSPKWSRKTLRDLEQWMRFGSRVFAHGFLSSGIV